MTKIYFCGQAPSRAGDGRAFSGPSGRRLAELVGLGDYEALARSFTLVNIFQEPAKPKSLPPKPGSRRRAAGDEFDAKLGRELGRHLIVAIADYDPDSVVVACGHQVFTALTGVRRMEFFKGRRVEGVEVWCFPHPSGASQFWNHPENVERAGEFIRKLLKRSGFEGA